MNMFSMPVRWAECLSRSVRAAAAIKISVVSAMLLSPAVSIASLPPVWRQDSSRVVADHRARVYIAPEKVLWKSSGDTAVINGENLLLHPGDGQAVLGYGNVCRMMTGDSLQASLLLDFGREIHGGVRIVTGQYPSGKPVKVRIRLGESAGEAMSDIGGAGGATNDHAVRDMEVLLPWLGTLETGSLGFRFLRLDLLDSGTELQIKEINACLIYQDIPYEGSFRSSDSRLDSIWMTGAYTVHLNLQNYLTEGIKRDRLVWVGDLHPEIMTTCAVFGRNEAVPRSLDLSRDTNPLPAWMNGISSYSIWWLVMQADWYRQFADTLYLSGQREYIKGLLSLLMSKVDKEGREHLDGMRFLDWPSSANTVAVDAGLQALMVMAMDAGAFLCDALGEDDMAEECRKTRELLATSGRSECRMFDSPDFNPVAPGNKQAAALLVLSGLMSPEEACRKCLLSGGPEGFSTFYGYYMLEAMAAAGRYEEAMDVIRSYWGGMLDLGATTFWEDFDISWMDGAARIDTLAADGRKDIHAEYGDYCYRGYRHSLAHGWASGPTAWLSRHVLGIRVIGPGIVRIEPHLGDLEWVEGSCPTACGTVRVRHEKDVSGRVRTEIWAPEGVEVISGSTEDNLQEEEQAGIPDLEMGFRDIPDSVQTAVYWYWISDNISREGVVKDLHAMKQAGINMAFIGNVGVDGVPQGDVGFMSDEWWDITATALKTASDLDIGIGIFNSPGWSQSGGPWVRPEQAMRYLRTDTLSVEGDGTVQEIALPDTVENAVLFKVLAYPALSGKSRTWVIDKSEGETLSCSLRPDADFTVRSLTVKVSAPINSSCSLYSVSDGKEDQICSFRIDRSNPALNVGFDPYAPVAISVPEVRSGEYVFRMDEDGSGKVSVTLSEIPRVGRFAEKSLAKMYQYPLPMWGEYMWEPSENSPDCAGIISPENVSDVTGYVSDHILKWQVPDGKWCVAAVSMVPTGVVNSPALPSATGLETDKMSREHIRSHFDAYIGKILERIPPQDRKTFKVVVQDSYETGGTNWTDDMEEVFRNEYGYDPIPFLPVLQGNVVGSEDMADRFLWDLRRLVADRVAYDYVGGLREACHEHSLETWLENYGHWGFPGEFLMYGGQSDHIAGEFWSEGTLGDIENRAASSCGHIYGKRKIWAESCTSGGPAFSRYPRVMKQRVDRFFTEGINSSLLHLYIQQPDDRKPGLDAWFGNEFNRNNTWFGCLDLFTDYLKRCNFMLQQGRYVADAAYFIGEDAPKMTGECNPPLPYGYSFDYINAEVLMKHASVRNGRLVLDSGMEYSVLVLPDQKTMRPELLSRIAELVNDGLVITGPAPESSPSLENYPHADAEVREIASGLWSDSVNVYGSGRVYPEGTPLRTIFRDLSLEPDFALASGQGDILSIHRTLEGSGAGPGEIWFVSNQRDGENHADMSFRVSSLVPQLWNPVTGEISAADFEERDGRIHVRLDLAPLESVFVVFRDMEAPPARQEKTRLLPLHPSWTVTFGKDAVPGNVTAEHGTFTVACDSLWDWTGSEDERIRYYSGTAVYRTDIKVRLKKDCRYFLDLGKVMVMAKVHVNGKYAGGVWTDPYVLDVTDFLKNGNNTLEIHVVNNWKNSLVRDSALPEAERTTWTNINPYDRDTPLQPSGLAGPVILIEKK